MKASLRLLISITWPLLLTTGLLAGPVQADPSRAVVRSSCEPYRPAVRDYTCDGRPDLLAQDSHGTLWIYPGNGDGGFKPRIKSGTGWHFTNIINAHVGAYGGVYARDKSGTLWIYPSNGHGGWLKPKRVGGGWNQMTSIIDETGHFALLAIDHSGTLWRYPYKVSIGHDMPRWLPRQRVGTGWAGRMLVDMKIGTEYPDFYARDTHGTLWPYSDNGKTIRRGVHSFGSGWGGYTRIVSDGDFENVDGYLDLVATDTHGDLWFYPSTSGGTAMGHRVKVGHGFTGYTIW